MLQCVSGVALERERISDWAASLSRESFVTVDTPSFSLLDVVTAVQEERIMPLFQPIVSLQCTGLQGFEVLARWNDPDRGSISPAQFIPAIEMAGILDLLLTSMIRQACRAARRCTESITLSFNISPAQIMHPNLPDLIVAAASGFPLSRIRLEIMGSSALWDTSVTMQVVEMLRGLGIGIIMDDFGTDYSSLSRLQKLPFMGIKIDASFIRPLCVDRQSRKIVMATIALAQGLGIPVTAEGIETEEQVVLLRKMGCPLGQGYLFGRGVLARDLPDLVSQFEVAAPERQDPFPISEQREAEVKAIYAANIAAIAFVRPNLTFLSINEAFARRLNLSRYEISGTHVASMLPPPLLKTLKATSIESLDSGQEMPDSIPPAIGHDDKGCNEVGRQVKESGKIVEVEWSGRGTDLFTVSKVWDAEGECLGYSLVGIDVTGDGKIASVSRQGAQLA